MPDRVYQGKGPLAGLRATEPPWPHPDRSTAPIIEICLARCYLEAMPSAGALSACHKEDDVLSLNFETASAVPVGATMTRAPTPVTSEELLAHILTQLDDDKAEDIVQNDLRGKTAIGDYMVICSGRSSRQVSSIAEKP